MELIATCAFGLEKLVRDELRNLGLWTTKIEDGRVTFEGEKEAIAKANFSSRIADRIQIKMGEIEAETFDQLFDQIASLPWEKYIGSNDVFPVQTTSTKCVLHSEPAIQSIVKKAVVTRLQKTHKTELLPENSEAIYHIHIKGNKDQFVISIDTSGESLHKRGYRTKANDAPMKETLAASIIKLSNWDMKRPLVDTFCGSGTIPIEAALIAKNSQPGINRTFTFQNWPWMKDVKIDLPKSTDHKPLIFAFDIDPVTLEIAKQNAKQAGVEEMIIFKCSDFNNLNFANFTDSTFITNPPYGERLEEASAVTKMYKQFGEKFKETKNCSLFLITSREDFSKLFGKKEDKNRKLFNGNLKCYLYSYL